MRGRAFEVVCDRDLGFTIGQDAGDRAIFAGMIEATANVLCKDERQRHQLAGLTRGVPVDGALVACALQGECGVFTEAGFERGINTAGDVCRLAAQFHDDAESPRLVARLLQGAAHRILRIDATLRGHLAGDDDAVACCHHLDGCACALVEEQNIVKDRVSDQVAQFVWVADTHGFSGSNSHFLAPTVWRWGLRNGTPSGMPCGEECVGQERALRSRSIMSSPGVEPE